MTDDVSEETDAEATRVAQALLSVIAKLHGIDRLPPFGREEEQIVLPDPDESLEVLARTPHLSEPAKLELLAQHARGSVDNEHVQNLALMLVDTAPGVSDETRRTHARELVNDLAGSEPGRDPLKRTFDELHNPPARVQHLVPAVRSFAIEYEPPDCDPEWVKVGDIPALSIKTTAHSTQPMNHFVNLIDPQNWPLCPLQHAFFRSMKPKVPPPPPLPKLQQPDAGWKALLREVVDFSFGLGLLECNTELDFVYFADVARVGCTYDFHDSTDGRISVDQGYLLLEDLEIPDVRRTTTLKQVHFTAGILPPGVVCPVWSAAMMIISWACTP